MAPGASSRWADLYEIEDGKIRRAHIFADPPKPSKPSGCRSRPCRKQT
jgi:hypothetical protein